MRANVSVRSQFVPRSVLCVVSGVSSVPGVSGASGAACVDFKFVSTSAREFFSDIGQFWWQLLVCLSGWRWRLTVCARGRGGKVPRTGGTRAASMRLSWQAACSQQKLPSVSN